MSTTSWDCKLEPLSDSELEEWLLFKDDVLDEENDAYPLKSDDCITAEQILQFKDLGKKKENNSDYWFEEFPLFNEIPHQTSSEKTKSRDVSSKSNQGQQNENSTLFNITGESAELDLLLPSYENLATFLLDQDVLFLDIQPHANTPNTQTENAQIFDYYTHKSFEESEIEKFPETDVTSTSPISEADPEIEMKVVDEIVRNTALELQSWESDASSSDTSSIFMSKSSSSLSDESSNDPEWSPEPVKSTTRKRGRKKKSNPYWRGGSQEDKKMRKKEQNKNAATRYRLKKKAEVSEILKTEEQLKERKAELEEKVSDIQNEIKYLKGLMRDLFKAKGLIE